MRAYQYLSTDATIDALRRLRGAWAGYQLTAKSLVVALADGGAVRIHVEGADVEPDFAAQRLSAAPAEAPAEPLSPAGAFGAGRNDLVVFRSETWIEAPAEPDDGVAGPDAVVQFTGSPLQRSATAAATCAVDDALVAATSAGTGMLVRCGLQPYALEVTTDSVTIARFLAERGYGAG